MGEFINECLKTKMLPPIVFEDDFILVLNKPSGLLSVPGKIELRDCLSVRIQKVYPDALTVHRLDQPTSGLILMARNSEVHKHLSNQFRFRVVKKRYVAWVDGYIQNESGEIDFPLSADWPNRPRQKINFESGKPSKTYYRRIAYNMEKHCSYVELEPFTGRTHQLRLHLSALGHPIWGDPLYASDDILKKSSRLLLHAEFLAFNHPITGEWLEYQVKADFDDELNAIFFNSKG
jgi:tRNA pseudouridine32 synthase / 23S rRNA pseudouridine746 synthase